jgi:hypothetical protein
LILKTIGFISRSFIIAGIPGIVIGFIILLTVREPKRGEKNVPSTVKVETSVGNSSTSAKEKFKQMIKLIRPSLLLLCIASSIRNAGMQMLFISVIRFVLFT